MATIRLKAPELPSNLDWLNVEQPVNLNEQVGKVVLLEFWTSCYVNCLRSLSDLHYLESKYKDRLLVIGVHSPKYPHERDHRALQKAVNRYQVKHPVINDASWALMKKFNISVWPSLLFIDPNGFIVGVLKGPGRRQQLDGLIHQHLTLAEHNDMRNDTPLRLMPRPETENVLAFPGGVLAQDQRLYISDSGHHRVLETKIDGTILRRFGSGSAGLLDGCHDEAMFNNPQGLLLIKDYLYVADTGNHAIRRIHLSNGEVATVIGNGTVGQTDKKQVYTDPSIAQINSPWGLVFHNGNIYISQAGAHQIWQWQLGVNHLAPFVGSGQEGLNDGFAEFASFAQPSGICAGDYGLYVADAESSSIRHIRMPSGQVSTLVGKGLHDFGDLDGPGQEARLQHPLDVKYDAKRQLLWVCDTYNNKIKFLRLGNNDIQSLDLVGLDEPSSLSLLNDTLWLCNTNAHQILRLDLNAGICTIVDIHE